MGNKQKICRLLLLALCFPTAACRFTPWETEPVCTDRYQKNTASLAKREAGGKNIKIVVISDAHNQLAKLERAITGINARGDIDFVVMVGDITESGVLLEYEWACEVFQKLNMPRFYAIGNHDAISFGKEIHQKMFGALDSTIRFRDSKFIIFNNNKYEFPEAPDYDWIAQQAVVNAGETRNHTVAFSHVSPNVDVYNLTEVEFEEAFFFSNGVGLTVHGHRHQFSFREDQFGTRHITVPTMADYFFSVLTLNSDFTVSLETCRKNCTVRASW